MRFLSLTVVLMVVLAACSQGDSAPAENGGQADEGAVATTTTAHTDGGSPDDGADDDDPGGAAMDPLPGSEGVCARVDVSALANLFTEEITEANTFDLTDGTACSWTSATEALDIDFYFDTDWFGEVVEGDESGLYVEIDGFDTPAYDNGLGGVALLAPNGWTVEIFAYFDVVQPDLTGVADAAVAAAES